MSEQERWEPGDIVLAADGALFMRSDPLAEDDSPNLVWLAAPDYAYADGIPGDHEESYPVRPLTLLVRGGQACPVKATTDAGTGQLADIVAQYRELCVQVANLVGELVTASVNVTRVIPDGRIQRGGVVLDGAAVRDRFKSAVKGLIELNDSLQKSGGKG